MNPNTGCTETARNTAWFIAIVGTFLIVAGLVVVMSHYTKPAPLGADRAAERYKILDELRLQTAKEMTGYAWQDPSKEIVRIPIQRAMEITLQEWRDPAKGRAELIARMEKATAVPPAAPAPANPYE